MNKLPQSYVKPSALADLAWALERIENYKSECLLDIHTDVDELWDWVDLLVDRARKVHEACVD